MMRSVNHHLFAILLSLSAGLAAAETPPNVLYEGRIEHGSGIQPEGFKAGGMLGGQSRHRAEWGQETGNRFLRLVLDPVNNARHVMWSTSQPIALAPWWQSLTLGFKVRTRNFKPGPESWHDARVIVTWHDATGRQVRQDAVSASKVEQAVWTNVRRTLEIPKGATTLRLEAGTFGASGTIDFDDLSLQPDRSR